MFYLEEDRAEAGEICVIGDLKFTIYRPDMNYPCRLTKRKRCRKGKLCDRNSRNLNAFKVDKIF
jgi:hypothetical protein